MALPSDLQWETRALVGSVNNGGGFSVSIAGGTGVDYSQQASPQLTHADGTCSSTTTFTSAAGGFTAQMQGNVINIVTVGSFMIAGFTNSTTITLDRSAGTISGKTYNVGGCKTLVTDLSDIPSVSGNKAWFLADGNYTAPFTNAVAGTDLLPMVYEGYSAVRGDGGKATVKVTGAVVSCPAYTTFKNFVWNGNGSGSTNVTVSNANVTLDNVFITNAANTLLSVTGDYFTMRRCEVGVISGSVDMVDFTGVKSCVIEDTLFNGNPSYTGIGIFGSGVIRFERCVITGALFEGVYIDTGFSGRVDFLSCDIFNNGRDGIRDYSTVNDIYAFTAKNCIFGKNLGYDMSYQNTDQSAVFGSAEWARIALNYNYFYTTGTGRYFHLPAGANDFALTGDPFVNSGSLNFTLNTQAGAGAVVIANPKIVSWADGVNSSTIYGGAMGYVPAGQTVNNAAIAGVAPAIDEVQFPTGIAEGATGGPQFSTVVIVAGNGIEQRVPLYTHGRYSWNAATGLKSPTDMAVITAFWLARQGRARGFRWQDWDDYKAIAEPLTITGGPTAQLQKTYTSGLVSYSRVIYKPQATPAATITRNASPYAAFTLDTTTGIVTWSAISSKAITSMNSPGSPCVITFATSPSGSFSIGDTVYFSGVVGMTQINGLLGVVSNVASFTITVGINTTGFGAYVSGGTVSKFVQPSDDVRATFQFDVPVRFDTDQLQVIQSSSQIRDFQTLNVIELTGG